MVVWASPVASALPRDLGSGQSTMTLAELGGSDGAVFYIRDDTTVTGMTFPVPLGLTPVEMRAQVELPVILQSGNLTVSQSGRTIVRINLPKEDQSGIVIPLKGVEVSGGWVSLTLAMSAIAGAGDNYCWNDDAPIRLVGTTVTFTGAVAVPTSVANFLPSVLEKVTIALPAKPSAFESDAAVQVAAAVARRNGQRTAVAVVGLPDGKTALDVPAPPLERQIVVKEGGPKGLSLKGAGIPSLVISGKGQELSEQARLLSNDALLYAASATAVSDDIPEEDLLSDATTVADVTRSTDVSNSALWPRVGIELDQTRFGHPLTAVQLHLTGSHTPLARDFGGEVMITVGDTVIDRWVATADGVIDRKVTIPDKLLKRFVNIGVAIRSTGDPGHCGDSLPVALRIDGKSTISVLPASPPVPQGMQSFPQALMPIVRFGIGPDRFGDTVRAAQIAVGMQRLSGVALTTEVSTIADTLASGGSAVLISPDGWNDPSVTLPYSTAGGKLTVQGIDRQGRSMSLTLDPAVRYASLQTVFDGQRSLLIASSNGAREQLDDLLGWLGAGRWGGLNGRAVVRVPGAEPLTVPNPPVAEPPAPSEGENSFFWVIAGGVAAITSVGALLILLRARRASG